MEYCDIDKISRMVGVSDGVVGVYKFVIFLLCCWIIDFFGGIDDVWEVDVIVIVVEN